MSAAPSRMRKTLRQLRRSTNPQHRRRAPHPRPPSPNRKPQAQPMRSSKLRPFESPRTPSATMPSRTVKRPTSAQEIGDEYHPGLCLDGILYDLTIDRLSGKICTFAHVTSVFCNKQSNKRGWNPARGFQPYFMWREKLLPDSNI